MDDDSWIDDVVERVASSADEHDATTRASTPEHFAALLTAVTARRTAVTQRDGVP
ncbi:MAG: hypothetical protein ACR2O6_02940 [Ilumatobacteraceae bacterium]